MRKYLIAIVILSAFMLTACGSTTTKPATDPATLPSKVVNNPVTPNPGVSCIMLSTEPTPGPDVPSLFAPVSSADWTRGSAHATVTFTVYSDFQCPNCKGLEPILKQLVVDHPEDLRVVYRHFPLITVHDKAALATQAAEAAGLQGKFWDMHDLLFEKQSEWEQLSPDDFIKWVSTQAEDLGLDSNQFKTDLNSEALVAKAQKAWDDGRQIPIPGTPFMLINGQAYTGPRDYDSLDRIIRLIALGKRQFTTCPAMSIDLTKQYIARLHTDKGDIAINLLADKAPITVNNFVFLARSGWYKNITFHRVIPGFVAQTGDPSGTGSGNPGYFIPDEINPLLKFDKPGVVGMANSGPNTNGSQFFITYAPASKLDGMYTIFGYVISGMDVLTNLTPRDPQLGTVLPSGDKLLSIEIEEK